MKDSPQPWINLLVELQNIDGSIIARKSYLNTPHALPVSNEEDPIVDLYKYTKKHVDKIKTSYLSAKLELEQVNRAQSSAGGFKAKIKTNVEYQAYNEKVELLSHDRSVLEDRVKELAKKMMEGMVELSRMEEQIAEDKKLSQREAAKYMSKMEGLKSEVADLHGKRKVLVQSIDNSLYELYMSLMDCSEGSAVVEAADRVCKGCRLIMPRNIYLDVISSNRVVHCPNCMRILYPHNHS